MVRSGLSAEQTTWRSTWVTRRLLRLPLPASALPQLSRLPAGSQPAQLVHSCRRLAGNYSHMLARNCIQTILKSNFNETVEQMSLEDIYLLQPTIDEAVIDLLTLLTDLLFIQPAISYYSIDETVADLLPLLYLLTYLLTYYLQPTISYSTYLFTYLRSNAYNILLLIMLFQI